MIRKIREIIQAYAIMMNPTEEQKMLANIRLRTCMGCEFWTTSEFNIEYCKKCGCATKAKIFTPKNLGGCPLNKWEV